MAWIELEQPTHVEDMDLSPGMLLRMDDGTERLVGHINKHGGVCDDCLEEAMAVAFQIIWSSTPELEEETSDCPVDGSLPG